MRLTAEQLAQPRGGVVTVGRACEPSSQCGGHHGLHRHRLRPLLISPMSNLLVAFLPGSG